jgi:hypothetical protein
MLADGATLPQRVAAAGGVESDGGAGADGPGDAGRAGDGADGLIDGEVVRVNPPSRQA